MVAFIMNTGIFGWVVVAWGCFMKEKKKNIMVFSVETIVNIFYDYVKLFVEVLVMFSEYNNKNKTVAI